jgi:hypothetical protein
MLRVFLVAALLAGCGDDPPTIRNLKYSPNAANVGVMETINIMVDYADSDDDISQIAFDLIAPSGTTQYSPMLPIQDPNQGAVGNVPSSIDGFAPAEVGDYFFDVWIIDLKGRFSNKLRGQIRSSPAM